MPTHSKAQSYLIPSPRFAHRREGGKEGKRGKEEKNTEVQRSNNLPKIAVLVVRLEFELRST